MSAFLLIAKGDTIMASNDMQVLMYKILKYLYECMKLSKEARLEDFSYNSKLFDIPKNYWLEIIYTLVTHGYIKGFKVYENKYKDVKLYIENDPPFKITYEGVIFLEENSGMKKASEFVKDSFNVVLSSLLGVIL